MKSAFIVLFLLLGCSTNGKIVESRDNFIEIALPPESVRPFCNGDDPDTVFFGVYAALDNVIYDFFYRSPQDKETCEETRTKFQKLLKISNLIHIAGTHPDTESDADFKKYVNQYPKDIGAYIRGVNAVFVRMDSNKGCVSYFEDDCNPPDRWGGVIPGKEAHF